METTSTKYVKNYCIIPLSHIFWHIIKWEQKKEERIETTIEDSGEKNAYDIDAIEINGWFSQWMAKSYLEPKPYIITVSTGK